MNKYSCLLTILIFLLTLHVNGQGDGVQKNVQNYTPSTLIDKNQAEFKLFNNLYTQTLFFNEEGTKQDAGGRSTYFTSIAEYNYGVSSNVTLGGELWFKSAYVGTAASSPTNVLTFSNSSKARTGMSLTLICL